MDKNALIHYRQVIDSRRFVFATSALIGSGLAATMGGLALGGAGLAVASMVRGEKSSTAIPAMPALGNAPSGAEATSAEKARIRKKTKTILTSPLQGDEFYGSAAPTLLGSGDTTKKTTLG